MGTRHPRPLVLDSGALIAIERADSRIRALLDLAANQDVAVYLPAPVIVEVWRGGGGRQARLASFIRHGVEDGNVQVAALDLTTALQIGVYLARLRAGRASVADAMVGWCALRFDATVLTGDPDDLRPLIPSDQIRKI